MIAQNKRLVIILLSVPIILLIPLIGRQFTHQLNWSPFDFVVMGIILLSTGLAGELVLRKVKKFEHRIGLCIALIVLFLLIWAELAVGIFGSPLGGS